MARPRKHNQHLPTGVYEKHGAFYRVVKGKWIRLGDTFEVTKGGMPGLLWRILEQHRSKIAPRTYASYKSAAKRLEKIFAEFAPEQVKPRDIAMVKQSLSHHPGVANHCLSFLRVVFNYALEEQLVESNPVVGIKCYAGGKRTRYLTDEEVQTIHARACPQLKSIIELLLLTGQRVGDVLSMRWSDLTSEGVKIAQSKTGAKFVMRWNPELRAAVERVRALGGNVRAMTLFYSATGAPMSYRGVWDKWTRACESARISDANIHDLRACAITAAKRQGLDARAVAGHSSETMTARYIRQRAEPVVDGPSFRQVLDN